MRTRTRSRALRIWRSKRWKTASHEVGSSPEKAQTIVETRRGSGMLALTTRATVGSVGRGMDDLEARELAKRIVFRAGRLALARIDRPGYLKWKGHRDVVSEATLEVQESIVTALQKECPGDGILSEEGPEDEPLAVEAERLWIVDPICGSLNFAHGIPFFAVSIALRVNGQLRVGVVHDPMRDETYAARIGDQATLNDRAINARTVALGPEFWEQAMVGADLPPSGPRCYVAAGRLHAYWTFDAKPWEVAAACVILAQAGGMVSDADGGSWLHSDGSYVAANPASHPWALKSLKFVRDRDREVQQAAKTN
ncbi:MAG: inositol monophosphatase [Chloroflexi bacterium]|nr:MAG: inositol monophosphatase [Chloroflexota bacterium]